MIYGMGSNYWSFVNVHVSARSCPMGHTGLTVDRWPSCPVPCGKRDQSSASYFHKTPIFACDFEWFRIICWCTKLNNDSFASKNLWGTCPLPTQLHLHVYPWGRTKLQFSIRDNGFDRHMQLFWCIQRKGLTKKGPDKDERQTQRANTAS